MKKYFLKYSSETSIRMTGFEVYDVRSLWDNADELPVDQNKHLSRFGFPLSDEEIFTFKWHVRLWKIFISSNELFCLIVEDNISLSHEQIEGFSECIREIAGDCSFKCVC